MRPPPALALLTGLLLAAPSPAGPSSAGPSSAGEGSPDDPVLARIADLHPGAATLRIDGSPRDWKGFPLFADGDPDPVADRGLDIEEVAVAPRGEDVVVMFSTAGPPSRAARAFSLDVDFLGHSGRDLGLRFGTTGGCEATAVAADGHRTPVRGLPVEVRAGEVVEVRIPLGPVAAALGKPGTAWLRGERRPFVRVQPWSWRTTEKGEEVADAGPAAASFRLTDPPPALDPPLPPDGEARRVLLMPLEGRWFLRQGVDGAWSHRGQNAYDLCIVDHTLRSTAKTGSKRLEDYLSFGRPIFAPEPGRVVFDSLEMEDSTPLEATSGKDSGNTLVVRFADGFRLSLAHLRRGSLAVDRGEEFRTGAVLAEVGNSGASGAPHLHLSLHERPGEFVGLPLGFRKVRVGLNPGADDPWARDLPEWTLREGWFVERRGE